MLIVPPGKIISTTNICLNSSASIAGDSGVVNDIGLGALTGAWHRTFHSTGVGTRSNHLTIVTTLESGVVPADLVLHVAGCAVTQLDVVPVQPTMQGIARRKRGNSNN